MLVESRVLDVTSTLEGERIGMTIDPGSLAHIMGILTDLYSDPELAVIREYSTNAFDAHVEAGVKRPIEIQTPTHLAPFFIVRDFGFGLDAEGIRNIYSQYGASTKRESNDVVGMLGLGCKSALTYTDQFTLRGIKDGIATQVSISRDEDGSGSMTIVDEYETDEPSGVEVTVPAKSHNYFAQKSASFYRFWNEGTVLVNGKAPERIGGMWVENDLLLTEEADQSYVVMGNVPYPMPNDSYHYHTVAFVNIGDVNFTPSREALMMNAKTKATLATINERMNKGKLVAFEKFVTEASSRPEAIARLREASLMGYRGKPQYKGQDIPDQFVPPTGETWISVTGTKPHGTKGWSKDRQVMAGSEKVLWVTGYDGKDFTPTKRAKLTQWVAEKGLTVDRSHTFVLVNEIPDTDWIEASTVYDWAEIAAQKIERNTVTVRGDRPSGSYRGNVDGVGKSVILADEIVTNNPIFFMGREEYHRNFCAILSAKYPNGYTVVELASNRLNKFKRDFPMAVELRSHLSELAATWVKTLTNDDKVFLQVQNDPEASSLSVFDHTQINDPEFAMVVRLASKKDSKLTAAHSMFSAYATLDEKPWTNPLSKYPLLNVRYYHYGSINKQHSYLYINAVHAANSTKEDN